MSDDDETALLAFPQDAQADRALAAQRRAAQPRAKPRSGGFESMGMAPPLCVAMRLLGNE